MASKFIFDACVNRNGFYISMIPETKNAVDCMMSDRLHVARSDAVRSLSNDSLN
jgi:hypothetical protein